MSHAAFYAIVELIKGHSVFDVSDPRRPGASPAEQASVAFYWFGRFGNGGGVVDVAFVCGCSEGSVVAFSRRVTEALYDMRQQVLCWASEQEKADAKAWVAERTKCVEFSRGWSMVDGSLFPLAFKPGRSAHHREYFDRKSNYSLNVQLVVLPTTLRIIDFVAGYKGSTQDSRAFAASDVVKNSGLYLDQGDFIWIDGGYGFSEFTCGPYDHIVASKSSEFRKYNYHVSNVRVRSEHAFGYLKGRFQSLRGIRMLLRNGEDHTRMVKTVVAMLVAHNLALRWDGEDERNVFVDLSSLSADAKRVWSELQDIGEDQETLEAEAWTRRTREYEARMASSAGTQTQLSQYAKDRARRSGAKALREELHVALFRSLGRPFVETSKESRLKDMTKEGLRRYKAEKARKAEQARLRRQEQREARRR
ncbi:hypothetical protein A4X13_0g8187 [Tilletia indica]|uniref:DDE Tnp4 domain-containing protein n=1 Tax=Tilletia indica TaxID=43049 RepID=A0A177T8M8_9BASI|nr:hypothetical protein A4X13_0g8187 [Tilletia indica]